MKLIKIKPFFVKTVVMLLIVSVGLGLLPVSELNDMITVALGAESDFDDSEYGYVTESPSSGMTSLTATANEHAGFRGWYRDGKEISADATIEVATDEVDEYSARFYNFNIIDNGGFEDYLKGEDLSLITGDEAWCSVTENASESAEFTVSEEVAKGGSKSLKIKNSGASYRKISGLDPNTSYSLAFYYSMNTPTTDYLDYVCIIDADNTVTPSANLGQASIDRKKLDAQSGTTAKGEWKQIKFCFNSGSSTEILLCMKYVSNSGDCLYIDDLSLVKDYKSSPTSGNYDFENKSVADWSVSDTKRATLTLDESDTYGYRLKGENKLSYGLVYSAPYEIISGYTYTFTYTVDLSGVTDPYTPEVDSSNNLVYDEDGNLVYTTDSNGKPIPSNNFNWGLSTVKGRSSTLTLGADGKTVEGYTGAYCDTTTEGTGCIKTVTDGKKTMTFQNKYSSGMAFNKPDWEQNLWYAYRIDWNKPLTITTTFTANKSSTVYLYFRLDGLGTYYVDNVNVTRTAPTVKSEIVKNKVFRPVGTAIRLTGDQGIRFKTRIDKALLTYNNDYGIRAVEYGTVAVKYEALGENELLIDGKYTLGNKTYSAKTGVAYSLQGGVNKVFAESNLIIDYTGVLTNISESNYVNDYAVRAYLKYYDSRGNLETIYSDTYYPSIYAVAKEAYSSKQKDGSFTESDSAREYLYNSILCRQSDRTVNIANMSSPINTDFDGTSSTVYHCFTFMDDPIHGRTYTDEQAAKEMDRLVDSGITSVRTIFKSSFAAGNLKQTYETVKVNGVDTSVKTGESFDGWKWDTPEMKAFYKWAKMLQDRKIDIIINAGWNVPFFITRTSSIPEIFYLLGYEEGYYDDDTYGVDITYGYKDKYNESANYAFTGKETAEERRMIIASLRYGEWMRQALEACKNNGVHNIKYLLAFTEPGRKDDPNLDKYDPTFCYPQWTRLIQGLHDALTKADLRDKYKIIGPNQLIYRHQERPIPFLDYYLDFEKENPEYAGMVDILSSHIYAMPIDGDTSIYDPYACYDCAEDNFSYFREILEENGAAGRDFWCDEFFATAKDAALGTNVGAQMTQFAASFTSAMNNGVDNIISWQIFDQLWTSQTNTGGEFVGGVHNCGTCPSFATIDDICKNGSSCPCRNYEKYASYTPRITYYGLNLLGKHMNAKSGSVFKTTVTGEEEGGLYAASMQDQKGNIIVLAVNTLGRATNVTFNLQTNPGYSKITRYTYNPKGITPTEEATAISSDGEFTLSGASFYDTIPSMSFSIYIYDAENIGDVDIPMDE